MRYKGENFKFNSYIPSSKTDKYVGLKESERDYAFALYEKLKLSTRSFYKVLRVARTIADFEGEEIVSDRHLMEASCYRFPEYTGGSNGNVF